MKERQTHPIKCSCGREGGVEIAEFDGSIYGPGTIDWTVARVIGVSDGFSFEGNLVNCDDCGTCVFAMIDQDRVNSPRRAEICR